MSAITRLGYPQSGGADTLLAQSTQTILARRWPERAYPHLSWLVLDAANGQVLAERWPSMEQPIAVGSLTKPFLAVAYGATHSGYPRAYCHGSRGVNAMGVAVDRCWLPRGHGELDLQAALANSCNAYFLGLARGIEPAALVNMAGTYGLPVPPVDASAATLIGLNGMWTIAPLTLARAYLQLLSQPVGGPILTGLRASARTGTAAALRREDALAKTGTAPCRRHCLVSSDGLVVAMTPAASPRLLLFVRMEGTTGAKAAAIAARMLEALRTHDADAR